MKTHQLSIPELSNALGLSGEVWFKREDLHHYRSHKGRSIPIMIDHYRDQGQKTFVISSSGNAALAAALYIEEHNRNHPNESLTLRIFVGLKIDEQKLNALKKIGAGSAAISIEQAANPKQLAFQVEKDGLAVWLRQSTDDNALVGYAELADELCKIENLAAIFIPTSSGTTAAGLFAAFEKRNMHPQIHIVQTDACHPFVESPRAATVPSLASAIVDTVGHRKNQMVGVLKTSHGAGWVATNTEIGSAMRLVKQETKIDISPNSALALVGLQKAVAAGFSWPGPVVCLITGA